MLEGAHYFCCSYTEEGEESVFVKSGSFECPVCRDICKCAKCRRARGEIGEPARRKKEEEDLPRELRQKKHRKGVDSDGSASEWSDQGGDVVKRGKKRRVDPAWDAIGLKGEDSNLGRRLAWIPATDGRRRNGKERAWSDGGSSWADGSSSDEEDEFGNKPRRFRVGPALDELPIHFKEKEPVVWHEGPERRRKWETPEPGEAVATELGGGRTMLMMDPPAAGYVTFSPISTLCLATESLFSLQSYFRRSPQ